MFIGREKELKLLNTLVTSDKFECLILYGRRRVGKTALLQYFSREHKTIFYSAKEKNDPLNLKNFSETVQLAIEGNSFGEFTDWEAAFTYIGKHAQDERLTVIIDEFPFIAATNPSVKSILQHVIDHLWQASKVFLILCGSSISFMENEVMGYKSPLYGRATAQLELLPFDYLTSAKFFPNYDNINKLLAYGILDGIPFYLKAFSDKLSIKENIKRNILSYGSILKEEPQILLRMEFREPGIYNSIFEAIAKGASKMNDISMGARIDSSKCSKYLSSLQEIKLINKNVPCSEPPTSKKSIYSFRDNFYAFWYRYIFEINDALDFLDEEELASDITANLNEYMGPIFEKICTQYMTNQAKAHNLPIVPWKIGRWWGNNPILKKQDDIDILCLDKSETKAIFCECKFRNEAFDIKEYRDLMNASEIFHSIKEKYFYILAKGGFTEAVNAQAKIDGVKLLTIDDLF
ncbi:MAG: ATP-binding protein [Phascolarctobacterium sp.]|nr:ATP-binding protein [Phascolarctobacterium sp.]